jgi:hypothetical protein
MNDRGGTGYLQWYQHAYARLHQMILVYHSRSPRVRYRSVNQPHHQRDTRQVFFQNIAAVARQKLVIPIIPVMRLIAQAVLWYVADCTYVVRHVDNASPSQALVFFADKGGNPRGLSALLVLSTPSLSTPLSLPPPQSRPFILEVDARRSSLPKLKLTNEIGRGSTGQVFNAQWHEIDVVAKISWDSDARKRLEMEAARYISLIEQNRVPQERIRRALPLFLGWYRGHSFDLMILTAEGQSCEGENWKSLSRNQL